jgi:5-methylcytosine-specific restriction endonuclease McrA
MTAELRRLHLTVSVGVCGSSWQVELDHIRPRTLGGPTEAGNLRCACRVHNQRAAVLELGEGLMRAARARPRRR